MWILSIIIYLAAPFTIKLFKALLRHSPVVNNERNNLCIFCNDGNARNAIYYCEDCNLSFCEDCGYVEKRTIHSCGQCKSSNIECRQRNSVNGELFVCKDCGSLNIETKLEIHRSCPSCRSSKINSVAKKRLMLVRQLRDVLNGFKFGYQELKALLREFRVLQQKTLGLRAVGYLHDPVIEQTLLSVYETIKSVSSEILERATEEIDLFKIQLEKFCNYSNWSASDFPQIELVIKQIEEDITQYQSYVRKMLSTPNKEQGLVKAKLNVIRYYKSIYDEYSEYLNLMPGELPVCAFKDIKFSKSTLHELKKGRGILFLTDQRMIFVKKIGWIRKRVQRIFNFNFNRILDVSITGRLFKKLNFILDQGNLHFSTSRRLMEAILDYLNISVNFGKYRVNDEKILNSLDQIQLSTKTLEKQIDRKIIQLIAGSSQEAIIEAQNQQGFISRSDNEQFEHSISQPNRMILKLQMEQYSIEQTIQNLEQKFNTGGINADMYIKQFRNLQSELFLIERKINVMQSENV